LANLSSGTYSLCITGTDGSISYNEYCLEVQITEPEPLSVTSKMALDGTQITLELEGSSFYTIELNGISIQTEASSVVLDLGKGWNTLKVFTDIPCQGIYEEQVSFFEKPIIFPNPVIDFVQVYLGNTEEDINVSIFSADGRLISSSSEYAQQGVIELNLSSLSTGIYYLKYEGKTIKGTSKVIKE
jgi:hypothetical protein